MTDEPVVPDEVMPAAGGPGGMPDLGGLLVYRTIRRNTGMWRLRSSLDQV